jgi:hypothetical protein
LTFTNNTELACSDIKQLYQKNKLETEENGCCHGSTHNTKLKCCNLKCGYMKDLYVNNQCCSHHENFANIVIADELQVIF